MEWSAELRPHLSEELAMRKMTIAMALLVTTLVSGCEQENSEYVIVSDPVKTLERFYNAVPAWPYQADTHRVEKVKGGYSALAVDDSANQVMASMGEPDAIDSTSPSGREAKQIISWLYVLEMTSPLNEGGAITTGVVVYFDESHQVIAADAIGIDQSNPIEDVPDVDRYMRSLACPKFRCHTVKLIAHVRTVPD